jgi:hypothetical protein
MRLWLVACCTLPHGLPQDKKKSKGFVVRTAYATCPVQPRARPRLLSALIAIALWATPSPGRYGADTG